MKISVTHIKTKENIEITCNNIVYKAVDKLLKGNFKVVPCYVCIKTDRDKGLTDLITYMEKYGYSF